MARKRGNREEQPLRDLGTERQWTELGSLDLRDGYDDGAMLVMENIRWQDGVLRPVAEAMEVTPSWRSKVVDMPNAIIHRPPSGGGRGYIVYGDNALYALPINILDSNGNGTIELSTDEPMLIYNVGETITVIEVIDNIVCVVTEFATMYAKYDSKEGYVWLGKLPELPVFQFEVEEYGGTKFAFSFGKNANDSGLGDYEEWQRAVYITEDYSDQSIYNMQVQLEQKVESHIEHTRGKAMLFHFHLFRYAFRLFDGSVIRHSAPVFVAPNNIMMVYDLFRYFNKKRVIDVSGEDKVTYTDGVLYYYDVSVRGTDIDIDNLKKWEGIIVGVDFYMTDSLAKSPKSISETMFDNKIRLRDFYSLSITAPYEYELEREVRNRLYNTNDRLYTIDLVHEVGIAAPFYKLASMPLEELLKWDPYRKITLPNEGCTIKQERYIVTQEVMPNEAYSHHEVGAKSAYTYNNRLRLSNIGLSLFKGYGLDMVVRSNNHMRSRDNFQGDEDYFTFDDEGKISITVTLDMESGERKEVEHIIKGKPNEVVYFNPYLSYPDRRAKRIHIYRKGRYFTAELKPHPTLDLAYYINGDPREIRLISSYVMPLIGSNNSSTETIIRGGLQWEN